MGSGSIDPVAALSRAVELEGGLPELVRQYFADYTIQVYLKQIELIYAYAIPTYVIDKRDFEFEVRYDQRTLDQVAKWKKKIDKHTEEHYPLIWKMKQRNNDSD